jgi:AraC-like DNA-binding protein
LSFLELYRGVHYKFPAHLRNQDWLKSGKVCRDGPDKSAIELFNDLRFERVLNLLRHTDLSILDIADEYDFKSTAYFYKSFKNRYSEKPRKFREWYRSRLIDK